MGLGASRLAGFGETRARCADARRRMYRGGGGLARTRVQNAFPQPGESKPSQKISVVARFTRWSSRAGGGISAAVSLWPAPRPRPESSLSPSRRSPDAHGHQARSRRRPGEPPARAASTGPHTRHVAAPCLASSDAERRRRCTRGANRACPPSSGDGGAASAHTVGSCSRYHELVAPWHRCDGAKEAEGLVLDPRGEIDLPGRSGRPAIARSECP